METKRGAERQIEKRKERVLERDGEEEIGALREGNRRQRERQTMKESRET